MLGGGIRISRNFVHRHEMRNFAKFRAPLHMVKCEYLGIHMVNIISRNFVRRHEMRNFAKFRAPLYGNPPPRAHDEDVNNLVRLEETHLGIFGQ